MQILCAYTRNLKLAFNRPEMADLQPFSWKKFCFAQLPCLSPIGCLVNGAISAVYGVLPFFF